MQVKLIITDNEKFAYSYALEKGIDWALNKEAEENEDPNNVSVELNVYGDFDEFVQKLGELKWMRRNGRENNLDFERIDEILKFKFWKWPEDFNNENLEQSPQSPQSQIQFHLFPSKAMPSVSEYIKFILRTSSRACTSTTKSLVVIFDNFRALNGGGSEDKEIDDRNTKWLLSLFPPTSIFSVNSHVASRQFEVQRMDDRVIEETIKMEWETDRMKFS